MAKASHYITGKAYWAKILGKPVPNYSNDGYEWTMDLSLDDKAKEMINQLGISDRIRNKGDARGDFISFKQRETRADGSKNEPIRVVNAKNQPWDHNNKIGNDSLVDVKFNVKDYGKGKKPGVYIQAVRVLDHIPYVTQDFDELPEDNEYVQKAPDAAATPDFNKDFGLEDDLDDDFE